MYSQLTGETATSFGRTMLQQILWGAEKQRFTTYGNETIEFSTFLVTKIDSYYYVDYVLRQMTAQKTEHFF